MSEHDRLVQVRERFARSPFHTSFLGARLARVERGEVDVELVSVTFLAPGREGLATARARVLKRGGRFG